MSIASLAFLFVCVLAASGLAAMLGIGGATIYTPIQVHLGIGIREAAATSLFLTMVLSAAALPVYHKARRVDLGLAFVLGLFTLSGSLAGGYCSGLVSAYSLTVLLMLAMAFAGITMIFQMGSGQPPFAGGSRFFWTRKTDGDEYRLHVPLALSLSLAAGFVSGMVGIGGGVMMVPVMVLIFAVPADIAIATSSLMVGLTALGGFVGHAMQGHWNWITSLILLPAIIMGSQMGSRLMLSVDKAKLRKAFGLFLILSAAGLVFRLMKQ